MHRLIMTSTVYRQSSQVAPTLQQADPDNVLLSRMPLRRMDAQTQHDSMLHATGDLDATPFGPPVPVEILPDGEVVAQRSAAGWRRSIYVLARRRSPLTMLELFDVPPMTPNCIERPHSLVPTQALQLTNSDHVKQHARNLAERLVATMGDDAQPAIVQAYLRIYARDPTPEEIAFAIESLAELSRHRQTRLQSQNKDAATVQVMALADYCHALLCSAEFAYID